MVLLSYVKGTALKLNHYFIEQDEIMTCQQAILGHCRHIAIGHLSVYAMQHDIIQHPRMP